MGDAAGPAPGYHLNEAESAAADRNLIAMARTELTKPERTRVMVLITMDTHNRDINWKLIEAGIDCLQGYYFGAPTIAPPWKNPPSIASR